MTAAAIVYEHVEIGEDGVPRIAGTTTKVIELVLERLAYGWSPEEVQFQHAYLTLGQVYAAFAYYSDHAAELDRDIARRQQRVEEQRRRAGPSPLAARLAAHKASTGH